MKSNVKYIDEPLIKNSRFSLSSILKTYNIEITGIIAIIGLFVIFGKLLNGNTDSPVNWGGNDNIFLLVLISGISFLAILISSLAVALWKDEKSDVRAVQKKIIVLGTIGAYLGIAAYYSFYLLEPFLIPYLVLMTSLYAILVPLVEPEYLVDTTWWKVYYDQMPWNTNTISVVKEAAPTINGSLMGPYDIYMILLLLIFLALIVVTIFNPTETISKETKDRLRESGYLRRGSNFFLLGSFLLYIWWWMTGNSLESFGFLLLGIAIFVKVGPLVIGVFSNPRTIKYVVRRLIIIVPTFVGTSILVYLLASLTGSPLDLLREQAVFACRGNVDCISVYIGQQAARLGLNAPIQIQWFNWLMQFAVGSMGNEYPISNLSVSTDFVNRIGPTLELAIIPLILSIFISIPLGIIAAKREYSATDTGINTFISVGIAFPSFLGLVIAQVILSIYFQLLPASGRTLAQCAVSPVNATPYPQCFASSQFLYTQIWLDNPILQTLMTASKWDWIFHMVIPTVVLSLLGLALFTRLVRSGMLEVLKMDYIMSARASGFSERVVTNKYALRNVLIPVITYVGLSIGFLLGGAPITETVMNWPGLGRLGLIAIIQYNYPLVMATTMIVALMVMGANLLTDIMYSVIDPRIQVS